MRRKPEPKFTVIYSDAPPDISEEEMKRRYDAFIKLLVDVYKKSLKEKLGKN